MKKDIIRIIDLIKQIYSPEELTPELEYQLAMQIMLIAHHDQKDKSQEDYIYHPLNVAKRCCSLRAKTAALLHDVVEDTPITLDDLKKCGIREEIVEAVDCLSKRKNETFTEYLLRISQNDLAIEVKFADMCHNSDESRFSTKEKDKARKYFEIYCKKMLALLDLVPGKIATLNPNLYREIIKKTTDYTRRE